MPSKKPIVQVVLDETTFKKLNEIALSEGRTRSNISAYIIKKYVDNYELSRNKANELSKI